MNLSALDAGSSVVSAIGKVCVSVVQRILAKNEQKENICGNVMRTLGPSFHCLEQTAGDAWFDGSARFLECKSVLSGYRNSEDAIIHKWKWRNLWGTKK